MSPIQYVRNAAAASAMLSSTSAATARMIAATVRTTVTRFGTV